MRLGKAWLFQARLPFLFSFSLALTRRKLREKEGQRQERPLCMQVPWPWFCQLKGHYDHSWSCFADDLREIFAPSPSKWWSWEDEWAEETMADLHSTSSVNEEATQVDVLIISGS